MRDALALLLVILGATTVRAQDATDFRWRQVLASQRAADRFTAMEVDPTNPDHIFVGTEAGTVYRTRDGGVTWIEVPLSPTNVDPRSIGGPTRPQIFVAPSLQLANLVPDTETVDPATELLASQGLFEDREGEGPGAQDQFQLPPRNLFGDALGAVLTPRTREALPVQWIDYCVGGRYPLLVATNRDVFASDDDGRTYIRLFQLTTSSELVEPGIQPVSQVQCSPADPNEIVVTTNRGLLWSRDGGLSFTEYIVGGVAGPVNAVAFDAPAAEEGRRPHLLVGQESLLFIGDPESRAGVQYAYPAMGALGTAPWSFIRWIEVTPSAQIWMATDNGPRASLDGGVTWFKPGSRLFNQDPSKQVHVGYDEDGDERIAIVMGGGTSPQAASSVWTTDDSGRTFEPFFAGVTRRSVNMVQSFPPDADGFSQWWILDSGALWTNSDPTEFEALDPREETIEWAEDRIARTQPLWTVLHNAYRRLHLSTEDIHAQERALHRRALIPIVEARFEWTDNFTNRFFATRGVSLFDIERNASTVAWGVFVEATWVLPEAVFGNPVPIRRDLMDLQRQIGFVIEDAWHERMTHLLRLAEGQASVFQAEVLRARVEALEGVMAVWVDNDFFNLELEELEEELLQ